MEKLECALALGDALPACDAKIAAIHRYWSEIRPEGRPMPGRQHFDPVAIPRLLPMIRLYDVYRHPWRFRYRLMGTELVRQVGRDLTGTWFDDKEATPQVSRSYANLVFVAAGLGISYRRGFPVFNAAHKDYLTSERIMLPLARDGSTVDIVLALTAYQLVSNEAILHHNA